MLLLVDFDPSSKILIRTLVYQAQWNRDSVYFGHYQIVMIVVVVEGYRMSLAVHQSCCEVRDELVIMVANYSQPFC